MLDSFLLIHLPMSDLGSESFTSNVYWAPAFDGFFSASLELTFPVTSCGSPVSAPSAASRGGEPESLLDRFVGLTLVSA